MSAPSSKAGKLLVAVRFALGPVAWGAPGLGLRLLGLSAQRNPHASYVTRLFGARDMALGLGVLLTHGDARRLWWRIGIGCDLLDAAAGVLSARKNELPRSTFTRVMLVVAALFGAALGTVALASEESERNGDCEVAHETSTRVPTRSRTARQGS